MRDEEYYRKIIAHHCQEVVKEIMKMVEHTDTPAGRLENKWQYLARYKQELRSSVQKYQHEHWWGRQQ